MLKIKDKTLPSLINLLLVLAMFFSINTYADLKKSPFDVVLPPDKELKLPSHKEFSGVYLNQSPLDSEFDFEFGFKEQKDEQEWLIGFDDNEESLSLDAQPNIELMDLDIQGVQPEALYDDPEIANRSANHSANRAHNAYPGCVDMALGQATQTGFTQAGQIQCRGIRITQKTKLEAVLVDIPKTANFDLYLFQVINGELKLKAHSSAGVGQTTERILMMANPSVYVLAAKAQTYTAGSSAVMAWFGYTQFDQQELNDSYAQATQINGIATVTGTMDHARDMDYFLYQFESGQTQLAFKFNTQINNLFTLEAYTAQGWVRALDNEVYNFGASGSSTALFRVRSGTGSASPNLKYSIFFSNPYKATKVTVYAQSNSLPRFSIFGAYNQVGNNTAYTGKTLDANRNPVPFVDVVLSERNAASQIRNFTAKSDKNGVYKKAISFPDCESSGQIYDTTQDYIASVGSVFYRWNINYTAYNVAAKTAVNSSNNIDDTFYRICSAKIIQWCANEMDPITKIRKTKCTPECTYENGRKRCPLAN